MPILLYHGVTNHPRRNLERFTVSPATFQEHVRIILDSGRVPLTIREVAEALRNERELPERPVAVTFDDGFSDVRHATESLLDADLKASVFIPTGQLGAHGILDEDGVCSLASAGGKVDVGAHSVTHPPLDEIALSQAKAEIVESKRAIEDLTQCQLTSFAYPYGRYDGRVRAAVEDAGFRAAAAVKNALSHDRDDPFAIARVTVLASTSSGSIEALLSGSGAPLSPARERLRTRAYRPVRRLRRRFQGSNHG